ncbi:MAG TPA: hypothetical protein VHA82_04020 [Ramlibacter sp.]|uniref:hypothetical protein n=1 Tax=Ramlibacter sp. TaxID=1917967 RepID=UPI002C68BF04|nr:hypothetical protein [Ramlibacter sp.]HVZ42956.1 hypothetical protein [Ramlibacter sp.]
MDFRDVDDVLEQNLASYRRASRALSLCLVMYESRCADICHRIGLVDFDAAQPLFDVLGSARARLMRMLQGQNFPLSERLDALVRHFERIEEPEVRRYWHERFRRGLQWPDDAQVAHLLDR